GLVEAWTVLDMLAGSGYYDDPKDQAWIKQGIDAVNSLSPEEKQRLKDMGFIPYDPNDPENYNPNNPIPDQDKDGIPDDKDSDRDGDGIPNDKDSSPDGVPPPQPDPKNPHQPPYPPTRP
ncbi:hypothetical protein, partial [Sulfuricurvum sp.]|uniref:hypothetical protein n=1 Tax=Sulfuricurvum sp. TaxID=2025608 RepID=UPI003BB5BB37